MPKKFVFVRFVAELIKPIFDNRSVKRASKFTFHGKGNTTITSYAYIAEVFFIRVKEDDFVKVTGDLQIRSVDVFASTTNLDELFQMFVDASVGKRALQMAARVLLIFRKPTGKEMPLLTSEINPPDTPVDCEKRYGECCPKCGSDRVQMVAESKRISIPYERIRLGMFDWLEAMTRGQPQGIG